MAGELTNYQWYGLVGKGFASVASDLRAGSLEKTSSQLSAAGLTMSAGGYDTQAASLNLQAEMERINAEAMSAQRLVEANNVAARNTVTNIAMGKTGEGSADIIARSNDINAEADVGRIQRGGEIKSIQAKLGAIGAEKNASAARSSARSNAIAGKAAFKSGIYSSIGSLSQIALAGSQLKSTPAKTEG